MNLAQKVLMCRNQLYIYACVQKLIFKNNILKNMIYKSIPIINLTKGIISLWEKTSKMYKGVPVSKRVPYSSIRRVNIVRISILPKIFTNSNATPIKIARYLLQIGSLLLVLLLFYKSSRSMARHGGTCL